jgi:hypothetical protein
MCTPSKASQERTVADLLYLALTVAFFVVALLVVKAVDRL